MRGNSGSAPLKLLDEEGLATGGKRWRFIPLNKRLEKSSARPSSLPWQDFDANLIDVTPDDTSFTHFKATLATEAESNITATFNSYYKKVSRISLSLPLLCRNRKKVLDETLHALEVSTTNGAEATPSISKCLAALSHDLGAEMFYPFFPHVIKGIANVFIADDAKHPRHSSSSGGHSIMWDPEMSIVPLFATLAEITKILLRQLAEDPRKALADLVPLFSSHNRRVREMTAESCVGYLVRKTRESVFLKDLAEALVEGAVQTTIPAEKDEYVIESLAACLFEAIRAPHGRLQSRAPELLRYAIRCIGGRPDKEQNASARENKMLTVVIRCFQDTLRHLNHEDDKNKICDLLLSEGELTKRADNVWGTGGILFLFRNWVQVERKFFHTTSGRRRVDSIFHFLCACIEAHGDQPQIVYEACGAVLQIALAGIANSRDQAVQQMTVSIQVVAKSCGRAGQLAALHALLLAPSVDLAPLLGVPLLTSLSLLYEQISRSWISVNCEIPLLSSVLLFRRLSGGSREAISYAAFKVPSLNAIVKGMLAEIGGRDQESKKSGNFSYGTISRKHVIIEYLCKIKVPGIAELFHSILHHESWTSSEFPAVLTAYSHNFEENAGPTDEKSPCLVELQERIRSRVRDVLFSESFPSATLLHALLQYVQTFPSTAKEWLMAGNDKTTRLFSVLSTGLKSASSDVRLNSASLLSSLHLILSEESRRHVSSVFNAHVDEVAQRLRAPSNSSVGEKHQAVYDSFVLLLSTPDSLEDIAGKERVLRELVRTSTWVGADSSTVETLVFFSLGLLRTPLQVLWEGAKDLWLSMANIDRTSAMHLALGFINEIEANIVEPINQESENGGIDRPTSEDDLLTTETDAVLTKVSPESLVSAPQENAAAPQGSMSPEMGSPSTQNDQHSLSSQKQRRKWYFREWKEPDMLGSFLNQVGCRAMPFSENEGAVDSATSLTQLLKGLSEDPTHTVQYRGRLIRSFLLLNSRSRFAKGVSHVLTSFTVLLERMGGLKCCETDTHLEKRMRDCLLSNLTKANTALQKATVRCLCASRSPFLKPHRESFIALVSDRTFREELTVLTESLHKHDEDSTHVEEYSDEDRQLCDVMTRISFSKMQGKQSKLESKRSAVLSFLVAKIPWKLAMPMITSLALATLHVKMETMEARRKRGTQKISDEDCTLPSPSVQKGILFTIEAIVKCCKRALDKESWERIALGTTLLLRKSVQGPVGQAVRSRALLILADMVEARSKDSEFFVGEAMQAVRSSDFGTAEYTANTGVPAFMRFVDAIMNSTSSSCAFSVVQEHEWALRYCIQAMRNSSAGLRAVTVSISVGESLVQSLVEASDRMDTTVSSLTQEYSTSLLDFTSTALREFLSWVTEYLSSTRAMQKMWFPVFERALTLTTELANLSSSQFRTLYPLGDALCELVEKGIGSVETRAKALQAIEAIIASAATEEYRCDLSQTSKVEPLIERLIPSLNTREMTDDREAIQSLCNIIASSPSKDTAAAGAVLKGVNAFALSKLHEPDFDKRIESLQVINGSLRTAMKGLEETPGIQAQDLVLRRKVDDTDKELICTCGPTAFSALLYGCLAAVRTDDTAVRGTAGYSLSLMAKWAGNCGDGKGRLQRTQMFTTLVSATASCKTMPIRREYSRSLGDLVRWRTHHSPELFIPEPEGGCALGWNAEALFSVMTGLSNFRDLDADFFENVVHLQPHRRGRALRQLAKHMRENYGGLSAKEDNLRKAVEVFSSSFALPLSLNIALEKTENTDARRAQFNRQAESREGAQRDVAIWAAELVGTSSAFLSWIPYKSFLSGLLRKLKSERDAENFKVLVNLLVSTSKAYPRLDDQRCCSPEESTNFLTSKIIPGMLSYVNSSAIEGEVLATSHDDFRGSKFSRRGKGAATFRAPIAIAAGELMTRLPARILDNHVSLLVAPLSGALRSRMSGPREEAKKALTTIILTLGPKYLNYILGQILNALKDGFRRDVCVYVISAVLTGVREYCKGDSENAAERKCFSVDGSCGLVSSFLIEELESGVQESKQGFTDPNVSSERERHASRRANKAFECIELLAEHVTFQDLANIVIIALLGSLKRANSAKLENKIRTALRHAVRGFSRNISMQAEDALKICYAYTSWSGMDTAQQTSNGSMDDAIRPDDQEWKGIESVSFGLQLLNAVISRNIESVKRSDKRGRLLQSMCEPFLTLVVSALTVGSDDLTYIAFRACQNLLKLPLSDRARVAEKLSQTIVDILASRSEGVSLHTHSSSGDDLFNACLRSGAVLLQEIGSRGFTAVSKERVETLVSISCNCIEHGSVDSRSAALALLRAVVSRKIILPCVYDALEKVNEMAIHSHSTSLRKSCIDLSVKFLVSFPLGSKRVRQNLEFFVRNLNYSSPDGRSAALQALEIIVKRFPSEALESERVYLFIALSAAGARDEDKDCRNLATNCLKGIFQKWNAGRETAELLQMGAMLAGVQFSKTDSNEELKYCGQKDSAVQRAGILGLTAAGLSGNVKKEQRKRIVGVALMVLKKARSDSEWETKYSVLRCIESCVGSEGEGDDVIVGEEIMWLWEEIADLLIAKHEWVRLAACRLLGRHLSAMGGRHVQLSERKTQQGWIWSRNDIVRNTMKALCVELEGSHISMELAEQAVKNLICIGDVLKMHPWVGGMEDAEDKEDKEDENEEKIGRTLRWLMTRMSGMASRGGTEEEDLIRRGCGLRFLIVTGTWWKRWIMERMGRIFIRAVVRVMENGELRMKSGGGRNEDEGTEGTKKGISASSVIELGQKLQEIVLKNMETEEYYKEYRRIAGLREASKLKRKRRQALEAATDVEKHAKKRRGRAEWRKSKKRGKEGKGHHISGKLTDEM